MQPAVIDLALVKRVFTDACVDPIDVGSLDPLRFDGLWCGQVDIQGMTAEGTTLIVPTIVAVDDLEERTTIICEQIGAAHDDPASDEPLGFDTIRVLDRAGDVDATCGIAAASPEVGLVAFTQVDELRPGEGQCTADSLPGSCSARHIWLAGADGSNPHRLLSTVDRDTPLAWTPHGSGLLVQTSSGGGLVLMDPNGTVTRQLAHDQLCALPCAGADDFDFSPDGTRLAFVRSYPEIDNGTVVAVVDIATGEVTELDATRTTNGPLAECFRSAGCEGLDGTPRWSHDGTQLVFGRQAMSPEADNEGTSAALYTVNADGTGLRRVTPEGLFAVDPHWSPDDATLLFTKVDLPGPGQRTFVDTIRPDGTNLQQLTDDADSNFAAWTLAGRVTFARSASGRPTTTGSWTLMADTRPKSAARSPSLPRRMHELSLSRADHGSQPDRRRSLAADALSHGRLRGWAGCAALRVYEDPIALRFPDHEGMEAAPMPTCRSVLLADGRRRCRAWRRLEPDAAESSCQRTGVDVVGLRGGLGTVSPRQRSSR